MNITPGEQDDIDWIVARRQSSGTNDQIAPYVDDILSRCRALVRSNPPLVAFVRDAHGLASRKAIAEWARVSDATLQGSAWNRLADGLSAIVG